jgi:hypothetical protein
MEFLEEGAKGESPNPHPKSLKLFVGCALRTTLRARVSPPIGVTQQELGKERH